MHVIIVIQHNYVAIETVAAVMVVVEQVVQQVDTTIINNNNNGMDLIMAPVVIRGVVIIQPAVVMIVSNNKLEPVMAITVNKIRVGGIIRHEMNMKIQLATSLLVTRNLIHQMIRYTHDAWFFSDKQTVFFFLLSVWLFNVMFVSFHMHTFKRTCADLFFFFVFIDSAGYRYFYRLQTNFFSFFFVYFNVSLMLSLSFFFSSAYFLPFLYTVCVCACI